ncbi:MAG: hypothetical protein ACT4PL_14550 [Phycisphaerales bacterium]
MLLAAALTALTLTLDDAPAVGPPSSPWNTTLSFDGSHAFRSDLRDGPGEVAVSRASASLTVGYALSERTKLSLALDAEASVYDFQNATALVAGTDEPLDDAYAAAIVPSVFHAINAEWAVFGGGVFAFAGESDADLGDSFTGGGFGGVRYAFCETFAMSFGLAATSRLEDSVLVLPLIGIEWQVSPTVKFVTERLGVRLTAKMNDAWSVGLFGSYQSREYRLEDDNLLPGGVARDRRVPVGAMVTYAPSAAFDATLRAGAVVYQEYRFDDADGDRVSEDHTRAAPFLALNISFRF